MWKTGQPVDVEEELWAVISLSECGQRKRKAKLILVTSRPLDLFKRAGSVFGNTQQRILKRSDCNSRGFVSRPKRRMSSTSVSLLID
jgi:hypothetical protein